MLLELNLKISNLEFEISTNDAKLRMLQGINEELENEIQLYDKAELDQMRKDYKKMAAESR